MQNDVWHLYFLMPDFLHLRNDTYTVRYRLTEPDVISGRMKLIDITPNADRNSLVVTFEITEKLAQHGELDLTISPDVLSPVNHDRNHYQVFLDGVPAEYYSSYMYKDYTESSFINLEVQFDGNAGTRQIEIVGTRVVPEFGVSILAIMLVSLVGVVMSAKYLGHTGNKL